MSEETTARVSNINLTIGLDKNNIPEKISWEATDAAPGIHESNN
jgi:hypothetical protein